MADWKIVEGDEGDERRVGSIIDAHAEALGVKFRSYRFRVEADGEMVAGITAWSLGPDLHIDMLGVDERHRKEGLGSALLARVEEAGRAEGCTTASIDTFSFQAPNYYPRHGYEEIFRYTLTDGTQHIYFSKCL